MSASSGLAQRFGGTTSVNRMPATSSRDKSLPNYLAPHRSLRRAMASASARMPQKLCPLGLDRLQERKFRAVRLFRRQAALHGASGATRRHMECPRRRFADIRRLLVCRLTKLHGARRRRCRRRCRADGVSVNWGLSVRKPSANLHYHHLRD
jgi:hypothetical protein